MFVGKKCHVSFFFFNHKTAYEVRISDWSQTCALPISHVGTRLPAPRLMTGDLDLATASLALTADPPESMETILRWADPTYEAVMQIDPRQPASRFRDRKSVV